MNPSWFSSSSQGGPPQPLDQANNSPLSLALSIAQSSTSDASTFPAKDGTHSDNWDSVDALLEGGQGPGSSGGHDPTKEDDVFDFLPPISNVDKSLMDDKFATTLKMDDKGDAGTWTNEWNPNWEVRPAQKQQRPTTKHLSAEEAKAQASKNGAPNPSSASPSSSSSSSNASSSSSSSSSSNSSNSSSNSSSVAIPPPGAAPAAPSSSSSSSNAPQKTNTTATKPITAPKMARIPPKTVDLGNSLVRPAKIPKLFVASRKEISESNAEELAKAIAAGAAAAGTLAESEYGERRRLEQKVEGLENKLQRMTQQESQAWANLTRERSIHSNALETSKEKVSTLTGEVEMLKQQLKAEQQSFAQQLEKERGRNTMVVELEEKLKREQEAKQEIKLRGDASLGKLKEYNTRLKTDRDRLKATLANEREEEKKQKETEKAQICAMEKTWIEERELNHDRHKQIQMLFEKEQARWAVEWEAEKERRVQAEKALEKQRFALDMEREKRGSVSTPSSSSSSSSILHYCTACQQEPFSSALVPCGHVLCTSCSCAVTSERPWCPKCRTTANYKQLLLFNAPPPTPPPLAPVVSQSPPPPPPPVYTKVPDPPSSKHRPYTPPPQQPRPPSQYSQTSSNYFMR